MTPPSAQQPSATLALNDVHMRYRSDLEPVLRGLTITIPAGSKVLNCGLIVADQVQVAVVGRTGAGKTSLFSAMQRFYEYDGDITIDDFDTSGGSCRMLVLSHVWCAFSLL